MRCGNTANLVMGLILAITCAALGQEPRLSPATDVPNPVEQDSPGEPPSEDRPADLVLFAGRTVEFQLPRGWVVKEVPVGREVRLLVGPGEMPDEPAKLKRGFWLGYQRYVVTGEPRPSLEAELPHSIDKATRGQARPLGPPQAIAVGSYPALQQNLEVRSERSRWFRRVSHVVAQTPWGLLELHGVAPVDVEDQVRAKLKVVLDSLRFHEPRPLPLATLPEIIAAQPALGSWKSLQGRLHLTREGKAELHFDRVATFRIDQEGKVVFSRPGERLSGHFTARDDVIYITWDDQSRINYRWKIHRGELWMLDHHGRSLRLKRLFDAPQDAQ